MPVYAPPALRHGLDELGYQFKQFYAPPLPENGFGIWFGSFSKVIADRLATEHRSLEHVRVKWAERRIALDMLRASS